MLPQVLLLGTPPHQPVPGHPHPLTTAPARRCFESSTQYLTWIVCSIHIPQSPFIGSELLGGTCGGEGPSPPCFSPGKADEPVSPTVQLHGLQARAPARLVPAAPFLGVRLASFWTARLPAGGCLRGYGPRETELFSVCTAQPCNTRFPA